jgi:MFS family permease
MLDPDLLPSSNALSAGVGTAIGMLGPVAAGLALALFAPAGAFVFDACTFLVVIVAVRRMKPSPPSDDESEVSWEAIKDGFRFLRGKRTIQSVFLADLNAMIFGFPMAVLPAVARSLNPEKEAQILGFLFAAPAAGAFLATLVSGRAKDVRRQGRAIMLAIVVWGGAIVVFGLTQTLWLSLAMLAIAGAADMVSGIFRQTILQAAVEDRYRGRLGGISMAVWATGPSVGDVESGVVASLTTVPVSIVSGGLICIAGIGLLRWFAPGFWRYDARDPMP